MSNAGCVSHVSRPQETQNGRDREHRPGNPIILHAPEKHQRHRTEGAGRASPAAQLKSTHWPNTSDTGRKEQEAQTRQLSQTPRTGQIPATQDGRSRKGKPGSSVKLHAPAKYQRHLMEGAGRANPAAQSKSTHWPNTSDTGRKEQEGQTRQLSQTPRTGQIPATQNGRSRKRKPGSSVKLHAPAKYQRHLTKGAGRANPAAQSNSTHRPNTSNTERKLQEALARQLSQTPRTGQIPATHEGRSRKGKPGSSVKLHAPTKYQRHMKEGKPGSSVKLHAPAKYQ